MAGFIFQKLSTLPVKLELVFAGRNQVGTISTLVSLLGAIKTANAIPI